MDADENLDQNTNGGLSFSESSSGKGSRSISGCFACSCPATQKQRFMELFVIFGFANELGSCSITKAEVLVILIGLQ